MVHLNFAVHPQLKFACFYALTVHVTVHGSGRFRRTETTECSGRNLKVGFGWVDTGVKTACFFSAGEAMSHRHGIEKISIAPKQVYLWGFLLRKNRSSHRPVRICLDIGRVAGSTSLLQLQNPKFLCFVADLFGVDAGMIVCYHLFWFARHPRALNHALWCKFLRRPCCPANFFLRSAREMPTAPPEDAPACVQRLNARALRCLQRFHEKHSQHTLPSEARITVIWSFSTCIA